MKAPTRPILALGSFDGVHLGHQQILTRALKLARRKRVTAAVLTCDPLPAQLICPDFTFVLTPLEEKTRILVELGITLIHIVRFDDQTRNTDPVEFVEQHLLPTRPAAVVAGHDHRFGRNGTGDVALLEKLLRAAGIELEVVPEFELFGVPVRSTRIREHLLLGHVRLATDLLGRYYSLDGKVVPGTGTGRRLGFPTINLAVNDREKLVPADGVYAGLVETAELRSRPAAVNIGHRPTFGGEARSVEAHIPHCRLDAAPSRARVLFVERLRPERKFPDSQALAEQIRADVAQALRITGDRPGASLASGRLSSETIDKRSSSE